ncbi:OmpA family protein [Telluribacter humicola]|uniref:OmpA family protein n=1 Tax=Telluribacter humicola TaxID=1720261 RepID=UPI001A97A378|nr:OmpA family protein [Telluribacter humicola]
MKKKKLYVVLSCLSLFASNAFAQYTYEGNNKMNTWSITGYGGVSRFFGDLSQYDFKRGEREDITGMWGLSLNKQITPVFGAQLTLFNGSLMGSRMDYTSLAPGETVPVSRDLYFKSPSFVQATIDGTMNLNRLLFGFNKLRRWKFDAHAGFGVMYFHTDVYDMNTDLLLLSSNTEASSTTAGKWDRNGTIYTREYVVPLGLAIHYELTRRFDIGVDFTINHVNTEKLDLTASDITRHATSQGIFGFYKGESKLDKWGYGAIALTYKLGRNAVMSKDGKYDISKGRYHLRWADPRALIPPPYNPTMEDADSIAKANMPAPVDPRLYTDSDSDGVADLFDKEPNTPAGSVVSGGGVAIDLDKYIRDAIRNNLPKDECEALFSNIEFDTDKATIRSASQTVLNQVIELLNMRPNCRIVLVGHADARAGYGYNMSLSRRRVEAAKRFLIRSGLTDASRILTEHYGEYRPLAPNTSAEGLQANRRVEIKIEPMNTLRSKYPAGYEQH